MTLGMIGYLVGSLTTGYIFFSMRHQWRETIIQTMMEVLEEGNYIEVRHEENGESILIPRKKS